MKSHQFETLLNFGTSKTSGGGGVELHKEIFRTVFNRSVVANITPPNLLFYPSFGTPDSSTGVGPKTISRCFS